jgi:hypothetical protein
MPPRVKRFLGILGCGLATFYSASQLFVLLTMLTAGMQPTTPTGAGVQVNGYPLPVQVLLLALGCAAIVACARLASPRPAPAPASASTDSPATTPAATDSASAARTGVWTQPPEPTTAPTPVERSEVTLNADGKSTDGKLPDPPGANGGSGSTGSSGAVGG